MSDSLKHQFLLACQSGNRNKIAACIELDVDINCTYQNGWTGLMICAADHKCEAMNVLLQHSDIRVNMKDNNYNNTALHIACDNNHPLAVARLCRVPGVELNTVDTIGHTPLHCAVYQGNIDCVRAMGQVQGVDWNIKTREGDTAVMMALKEEKKDIVRVLVECPGVDLNTMDRDNKTLQQVARERNMADMISILPSTA
eukprot:GFUD01017161.1.p1 GENE.GFUD01017161.1~~GFUD01017161.1.p1  ORF type:complete len:199 (-),score=64.29 GFUD01017161.1:265-861(-)